MLIKPVFLWTDLLLYGLVVVTIVAIVWTRKQSQWAEQWRRVGQRKLGMIALVLLIAYGSVALLDSFHFRIINHNPTDSGYLVNQQVQSLLDVALYPLGQRDETTYSSPFAIYSDAKETIEQNNTVTTFFPRLIYGGRHLQNPAYHVRDVVLKSTIAIVYGIAISLLMNYLLLILLARKHATTQRVMLTRIWQHKTNLVWKEVFLTLSFVVMTATYIKFVSPYYHILGTDKIGGDILFETIKSIRTGLIIGTLTTMVMLPFAVLLGAIAGYFGGWRDDVIQYVYTTLSSVPGVLLISAAVLSLQVYITNHPNTFPTLESRSDARLLALCIILGITSWTSLCRLLRAETLKLRETDYVKASITMGVNSGMIIWRHIVPNVMHIILITLVLDFSALVLAEAVLSYVGVGVDPITASWGNMINSARLDLAREPVVWWPLFAAFIFMFVLVLAANLFSDAVRDAFDPRSRNEV